MKGWKFKAVYSGPYKWDWIPVRIKDDYLNGYFFGVWFIGWMR
jgi:hypothetical protein